jgi:hypothetical protein
MELKYQHRESYAASRDAGRKDATKRPWWDRAIFGAVSAFSWSLIDGWLTHHTSLDTFSRIAIGLVVVVLLVVATSLVLDKFRGISGS